MAARAHAPRSVDFDELMRHLMVVGFVGLAAWAVAGLLGVVGGYVTVAPSATVRFLFAVAVLVFSRRTYWQIREWRWKRLPPDDRYGFANPLWEHARSNETLAVREGDVEVHADPGATGSSHPQG